MDFFALLTVAGVAIFLASLGSKTSTISIKQRLDIAKSAVDGVERLKRRLYEEMRQTKDRARKAHLLDQLKEEKEASLGLRRAYQRINEEFHRALDELSQQKVEIEELRQHLGFLFSEKNKRISDIQHFNDRIKPYRDEIGEVLDARRRGRELSNWAGTLDRARNQIADYRQKIDRIKVRLESGQKEIDRQKVAVDRAYAQFRYSREKIFGEKE